MSILSNSITNGQYTVTDTITKYNNVIINHIFKCQNNDTKYISVSYTYRGQNPISAKIIFDEDFEADIGETANMLRELLLYVYNKIPTIHKFMLDDILHIKYTDSEPLHLGYVHIAYNSCTWYEQYLGAVMVDEERYEARLAFLTKTDDKLDFIRFLQIAKPPTKQINYLESVYVAAKTYRDFFRELSPDMLCPWLNTFMEFYLKDIAINSGWIIDVTSPTFRICLAKKDDSKYRIIAYKSIHLM